MKKDENVKVLYCDHPDCGRRIGKYSSIKGHICIGCSKDFCVDHLVEYESNGVNVRYKNTYLCDECVKLLACEENGESTLELKTDGYKFIEGEK